MVWWHALYNGKKPELMWEVGGEEESVPQFQAELQFPQTTESEDEMSTFPSSCSFVTDVFRAVITLFCTIINIYIS